MKERKISRRAVCSAMVASLALGVLEGCGSSSSTTASSAAGSGAAASNERITVRILKSKAANEVAAEQMTGPLIYGISADPVAAAKVLNDFAKTNDKLVLKAGCYAGKVLDKAGVQALASIPSRDELLAKLLGIMQAPVSGFARALAALAKQREEAAA